MRIRAVPVALFTLGLSLMACNTTELPQVNTDARQEANQAKANLAGQVPFSEHTHPRVRPYTKGVPATQVLPAIADRPVTLSVQATAPAVDVTIYHSPLLPPSYAYRNGGPIHARMLANLLGHYSNIKVTIKPIGEYIPGSALTARRVFYIGSVYDDAIPEAFLNDIKAGAPVTWMNYNVWKLGTTLNTMGLTYQQIISAYTPDVWGSTFNKVNYKGYTYQKYSAPQEMVQLSADTSRTDVQVAATAIDGSGNTMPYAVRSGKFWFIADNPFSYIYPTDRYLVVSDLIHQMVGATQTCTPQALLRLEDISAGTDPTGFKLMLDTIQQTGVPFAMTLIPRFQYDGVEYPWQNNGQMLNLVYRAIRMGGVPIQHGYLHKFEGLQNLTGNSGVDWEFWNKATNTPVAGLTTQATQQRLQAGRNILLGLGINPQIWTTPHYEAATELYPTINAMYPMSLERKMYSEDGLIAGQFYPYVARDKYGTLAFPENLGNIQEDYGIPQILEAARANRNLQCPVASFFIHPYLLEPDYTGSDAIKPADFLKLINDIKAMGYTFVRPADMKLQTVP